MNGKEKVFWNEFLELYQSMPCLWKIKSDEYCDRVLKNSCCQKMEEKMKEVDPDANREKVVKKINVFRTNYKRDLKKRKRAKSLVRQQKMYLSLRCGILINYNFWKNRSALQQEYVPWILKVSILNVWQGQKAPPSKKQKQNAEDNLLKIACEKLTKSDDSSTALSKGWETQYKDLTKTQQIFSRTIFGDVLFHGCLEKLSEKSVEDIHKVLRGVSETPQATTQYLSRTSTPYSDDYSSQSTSTSNRHFDQPLFTVSSGQTQTFVPIRGPIVQNSHPVVTNHQIYQPTQSPITQFINEFVDE